LLWFEAAWLVCAAPFGNAEVGGSSPPRPSTSSHQAPSMARHRTGGNGCFDTALGLLLSADLPGRTRRFRTVTDTSPDNARWGLDDCAFACQKPVRRLCQWGPGRRR